MGVHDGHRAHLRQRFIEHGLDAFADHEALELLLFYAIPRKDTNALAHRLMQRYGSLEAVLKAPLQDLERIDGIGRATALLLNLTLSICRKAETSGRKGEVILNSTEKAGDYLLALLRGETREVVYELCLDQKGKLLVCKCITKGTVSGAQLNLREVVENALLSNATAVILSHNHPSGIALPSDADFLTTNRVKDALQPVGIQLIDHIIVADQDYVSLADSGFLSVSH